MSQNVLSDILVPEQVADILKVPVKRVIRLAKRGEIPAKKIGRGEWRFKGTEILKWFEDWQPNTFNPNKIAGEIIEAYNGKKKTRV